MCARARNLSLHEKQYEAFVRYVDDGQTYNEIGVTLGVDRHTASMYVRDETERRTGEFADRRATEIERSLAVYRQTEAHYLAQLAAGDPHGNAGRYVIMARRAIDALLGLSAPLKIEDVPVRRQPLTPEEHTAMLRLALALDPKSPDSIAPYFQELKAAAALQRQPQRTEDDL